MSAFSGYVAAIVCRSVQVERPSASTSGGQSEGMEGSGCVAGAARGVVGVVDVAEFAVVVLEDVGESALACFVRARHEDTEVQVRQLRGFVSLEWVVWYIRMAVGGSYGFPSLSRTTPLGKAESVSCDCVVFVADFLLKR